IVGRDRDSIQDHRAVMSSLLTRPNDDPISSGSACAEVQGGCVGLTCYTTANVNGVAWIDGRPGNVGKIFEGTRPGLSVTRCDHCIVDVPIGASGSCGTKK
ncbi:MAG: hypothetical protein ACXWRE_15105, partial [Pseudobdellovibrionaceae bacterium]